MPKKACCCKQPPPPSAESCCRPIYNGCLDKTYVFTVRFTARYPCMGLFYEDAFYQCNSSSRSFSIPGNPETYEIVVRHTISKTPKLYDDIYSVPGLNIRQPVPTNPPPPSWCPGYYGVAERPWPCYGSNFDPTDPSTWNNIKTFPPNPSQPFGSQCDCTGCDCFTTEPYASCNFAEDKLKPECNCNIGQRSWTYRCPNGYQFDSAYGPEFIGTPNVQCPPDGFGNPGGTPSVISAGSYPTDFWNKCYREYYLGRYSNQFTEFGPCPNPLPGGTPTCLQFCSNTGADGNVANIPDSYSIQFVPNPAYPEQMDSNYTPKLEPELLNFNYTCTALKKYYSQPARDVEGYTIQLNMAFGYRNEFNCGTESNPVYEILEFPLGLVTDPLFGISVYTGPNISTAYNRPSFEDDPMNMCVPVTTQRYNQICSSGTYNFLPLCGDSPIYWDEYRKCIFGRESWAFDAYTWYFTGDPVAQLFANNCPNLLLGVGYDANFPQCNWFRIDETIVVEEE